MYLVTMYHRLFAVVVHIGRGPNHGHYVAVVKSGGRWLLFDDEIVELVNEQVRCGRALKRMGVFASCVLMRVDACVPVAVEG